MNASSMRGLWHATIISLTILFWIKPSESAPPDWPKSVIIGTASPGGVYTVYGEELAKVLSSALNIPVSTQSSQGATQDMILLEKGDIQIGMSTMGVALESWSGTGSWTHGKKFNGMRAIFPMYDSPLMAAVLKDSGIHSFEGMAGKRIGAGPAGSTAGTYGQKIFNLLNIPVTVRNAAWSEITAQLQQHLMDVVFSLVGNPFPALEDLDRQSPLEFVNLTPRQMATIRKERPEFSPSIVPAGSYAALKTDYHSVGVYNFAVVDKDLPDDLVYAIVKAVFSNHARLVAANESARETIASNVTHNSFLPYHPGALRYYREIGISIPSKLAAPN